MIDPNFTDLANLTESFDAQPMIINGFINGTTPVSLTVVGNVAAVVSQPSYTFMMGLEVIQTVFQFIVGVAVVCGFVHDFLKKRR